MLLSEALERFLTSLEADDRTDRTIGTYKQRICRFITFMGERDILELGQVCPDDVDAWSVALKRQKTRWADHRFKPSTNGGLSKATRAGLIQAVQAFFDWCVSREHLERSPAGHLKKPRQSQGERSAREKLMTVEDLQRILDVAERRAQEGHPRDLAIIRFVAESGARRGEVASLRLENLDLEGGTALVTGKTTGEEDVRPVDFGQGSRVALTRWLAARPDVAHDFVFVNLHPSPKRWGEPLGKAGVYQVFRRLATAAGVTGLYNPHALRHLVGQHFTDNTNLEITRQKLGHKKITTTSEFYSHQDRERVKGATDTHSLLNLLRGQDADE